MPSQGVLGKEVAPVNLCDLYKSSLLNWYILPVSICTLCTSLQICAPTANVPSTRLLTELGAGARGLQERVAGYFWQA